MSGEPGSIQAGMTGATGRDGALEGPLLGRLDAIVSSVAAPPLALTTRQAWIVAATALGLGLWLDLLFTGAGLGINLPIWTASVAAAVVAGASRAGRPLAPDRVGALVLAVLLYAVFGWRDSIALSVFGWLGGTALLFLAVALPRDASLLRVSVTACVLALASTIVALGTAPLRISARLLSSAVPTLRTGRHTLPFARGIVLALPLLAVFGTLFVAADAVFAEGVARVFSLDLSAVRPHVFRTVFGSWVGLAALWTAMATVPPRDLAVQLPERYRLSRVEVGVVLGSLVVLFGLFVFVQVQYLFGGADLVRASVSLTYAQYARRGFFELVFAALLLLPVLASIHWARERNLSTLRLFLVLAGALGVLLLAIVASAGQRLAVYLEAYGLTELRLYAVATLPWLMATLATFFVLVIRGRVEAFLSVAGAFAVTVLLGLYVLNPDAFIANTNLDRIAEGKPFDAVYVSQLSADAAPALAARLDELSEADRCLVTESLRRYEVQVGGAPVARPGWRAWNYGRSRAADAIDGLPEPCVSLR